MNPEFVAAAVLRSVTIYLHTNWKGAATALEAMPLPGGCVCHYSRDEESVSRLPSNRPFFQIPC